MFLNFGSLNIDYVYMVAHIVRPGETLDTIRPATYSGGKGLNQSIALARAGLPTAHAGKIGPDGQFLKDLLRENGVNVENVVRDESSATGHALIQVEPSGQNAILLYGGANREISPEMTERAFAPYGTGDTLVLQNELNNTAELIRKGHEKGLTVVLNCAPFSPDAKSYPLELVDILFVNETEGEGLTGETEPEKILQSLSQICRGTVVLTLGTKGAMAMQNGRTEVCGIIPVKAVDTTGAGDTYTGYFLAGFNAGMSLKDTMELAASASALEVTRAGAAPSIPTMPEVLEFKKNHSFA